MCIRKALQCPTARLDSRESCHTREWVMSHVWMNHVTGMNESCHTCEWITSQVWMSHFYWKLIVGIPRIRGLLYSPWQPLGILTYLDLSCMRANYGTENSQEICQDKRVQKEEEQVLKVSRELRCGTCLSCARVLVQRVLKRGPETREFKKKNMFSRKQEVLRIELGPPLHARASWYRKFSRELSRQRELTKEEEEVEEWLKRSCELSWDLSCMCASHGGENFSESENCHWQRQGNWREDDEWLLRIWDGFS